MKEEILKLRAEGKSYREIQEILGCSKSTICFHCGKGQKEKNRSRTQRLRRENTLLRKVENFKRARPGPKQKPSNKPVNQCTKDKVYKFQIRDKDLGYKRLAETAIVFSFKDVLDRVGENPVCYLSGRPIDLKQPKTYHFDHKVPVSRGGTNSLENLGVACREANYAKSDLLTEELLDLCKDILKHNGYKVVAPTV